MPKTKKPYWSYVKSIIRDYPRLRAEINRIREPRVTSRMGGSGGGSGISNPTMDAVIHDLPPREQKKYDAVENAIERTEQLHPDTVKERMMIIDLVYWRQTHTIEGAAMRVPCHRNVAGNWQAEFIRIIADELELV
ncbi:MAG: hypothetical protein VB031_02275 [Eubacteriaceae bacterium]|nr:hypothetical protein [Eubacteriaceae bacterium]